MQDCVWPQGLFAIFLNFTDYSIVLLLESPNSTLYTNVSYPMEGESILLTCTSRGNPPPVIWWVKRDLSEWTYIGNKTHLQFAVDIISSRNDLEAPMTTSYLSISNSLPSDSGEYFCVANNSNTLAPIVTVINVNINESALTISLTCTCGTKLDLFPKNYHIKNN